MNRIKESLSDTFKFKIIYFRLVENKKFIEDPSLKDIQEDLEKVLKFRHKKKKKIKKKIFKLFFQFLKKLFFTKI